MSALCTDREGLCSHATITKIGGPLTGDLNEIAIAGSFDSLAVKGTRGGIEVVNLKFGVVDSSRPSEDHVYAGGLLDPWGLEGQKQSLRC